MSASWRARRSIRRLSKNDSAIRATASAIAVAASTTASVLIAWKWSKTRTPSASDVKTAGKMKTRASGTPLRAGADSGRQAA